MSVKPYLALLIVSVAANGCGRLRATAQDFAATGDRYSQEGRYSAAIIEYRNAIKRNPRFAPAHARLAALYEAMNRNEDAYREYANAIALDADDTQSRLAAGRLLFDAHMFQETQIRAEQVLERDPRNPDALVLFARAYAAQTLAMGDRAGAEAVLRGAVRQVPASVEAHVALAEFLGATGRSDEAERELVATVQAHPADELANRSLASLYLATDRSAAAEPYLKAAAAVAPQRHQSSLALADYYTAQRRFAEARTALQRADTDPAQRVAARVRLADIEEESGSHAEARKMLDAILKRNRTPEALALDAQLLLHDGKTDQAWQSARAALDQDPHLPAANYVAGQIDLARGEYDAAEHEFRDAATSQRLTAAAHLHLAQALLALDRPDEALEFAESAGDAYDARLTRAQALVATGDTDSARTDLAALAAERPKDPTPVTLLARLELDAGDVAAARQHAAQAIAAAPNDPTAVLIAGRAALADHDTAAAEPLLARALAAQPSLDAATDLAQLYVARRDFDRARALFESIARAYPDAAAPRTAEGIVLEKAGRTAEARAAYEQAIARDPTDPVASYALARMYTDDPNMVESAVTLAQTAAAGAPADADVHATLGWAYYKTGRLRSASDELERAVSLDPKDETYRTHLAEVKQALAKETHEEASVRRTAM
ncbi:MAG TPA: tetratricopeptide repeat protein [Vicinamibacterales bacterium]|nr:tetratricopeptide repeat protein [Vicinamibacterales bacterium]